MSGQKASLQTAQRSVSLTMWCRLFLVFLVSAASADHLQAWKTDTEYEYNVRSRTLAALHDVTDQYTGIVLRARLQIKPKSRGILEAKVSNAQYAQIHTKLPDGWKTEIPDHKLDLKKLPMSPQVFEIKMRHGVVRDLIVDKDVPSWEVNVLKSIVSQLQVDTQGENLMPSRYNQEPEDDRVNAMYKTMEDSVGGKCEVLYDISNLPEFVVQRKPELVPMPHLRGEGEVIDIVKTKNYSNCEQRMSHHFGIAGSNKWEPGTNDNGKFMSRSSVSRIVITGDLKTFTIQSSVTTNQVVMSPNLHENEKGMVSSRVNLTLAKMGPVTAGPWTPAANPESTGNLVYSFNIPFASPGKARRASRPDAAPGNSEERLRRYLNNQRQNDDDDDSSASKSSKSADSLQSDEDQLYLQPRPTLNDAPSTPLLPFFVGYKGRTIDASGNFDVVVEAKNVASQIGSDLQNPNNIPDEQTLEKFTILARLIRTMNTKQIADVQSEVYQSENEVDPHDAAQSVRANTWAAFRDAVAQAGTGPALVTIKDWIKEKKLKGAEAASVVGSLSKTARTPTPEYMDAFFELATMPETTNQPLLNSTAIISFAELIRYSQVNHQSAHNRYPVHSFGRLSPKHNPAIFRDYVPYMAEKLKESIKNNEAAKSHVFIRALGNVAHPNILPIFEPYLEGKIPASTFQRTLMVFSMNKLAALRPRLARGVLYRIYQNTAEAHQVRCAAVAFLMSTNPPESMLQRMAEFTNSDHSKNVNAAVKSAIETASELQTPESQDLAKKAHNVRSLLNKESYGIEYSRNVFLDNEAKEMNLAYQAQTSYIGSDDSFVPQAFYATMKAIYGDFQAPKPELAAMVSSVKELFKELEKQLSPQNKEPKLKPIEMKKSISFSPESIAKLLKIEDEDEEDLEGAFWMKSKYSNRFVSFDKQTLRHIPELIKKASSSLKEGRNFNMAKLESYDLTMSFPMESGFPFVYTMKVPALLKASGSVKGENGPEKAQGSIDLRLVYSMQVQARLGFVMPYNHQHYMAGTNKNLQVHVPIHVGVKYDKSENQVTLKIQPIEPNEKNKIVHYSVVPFTSQHDILNVSPVTKDEQTHKLKKRELWTRESEYGGPTRGMNFKIQAMTGVPFEDKEGWGWDPVGITAFPFGEEEIEETKTELTMIPNPASEQSIILTGSIEALEDDTTEYDENRSNSSPKGKAPKIKSEKINDPERRNELLKEAAKGIAAANAFAIDFGVELPGQEPFQWIMTMAAANSDVDEKSRVLAFWRYNDGRFQRSMQSCIGVEGKGPRTTVVPGSEKAVSPSRSFDADIRFGESCEEENSFHFQIHGKQEQTDDYKKLVQELPAMLECMKELKRGEKFMPACLVARAKASTMDKSRIIIKLDPDLGAGKALQHNLGSLTDLFPKLRSTYQDDETIGKDTVKISMDLVQPKNKGQIVIDMENLRLVATDLDIDQYPAVAVLATNANSDLSLNDRLNMNSDDDSDKESMCVIDSKSATTFDKATYPAELGKCWHVAMTTYPKSKKDNKDAEPIDEDMAVSVVVRDTEENKKEAKIVLGTDQLELTSDGAKVRVELNGKTVDLSKNRSYRKKNDEGDLDFEIIQRADGSVRLSSSKHDVEATYDGERLQIDASDEYRNDVRGLCGNFDGEPANDFMSPQKCVLSKPEQFVGSYAITSHQCEGQALKNAKEANEVDCIRNTVRPGNVISDREAGRSRKGKNNWGFHNDKNNDDKNQDNRHRHHCITKRTKVIEEDKQTCFSLRPVPTCTSECKPVYTKPKVMPFYCMPKEEAQQLADRIQQGANPDLSQKKMSTTISFEMPVHCHAA